MRSVTRRKCIFASRRTEPVVGMSSAVIEVRLMLPVTALDVVRKSTSRRAPIARNAAQAAPPAPCPGRNGAHQRAATASIGTRRARSRSTATARPRPHSPFSAGHRAPGQARFPAEGVVPQAYISRNQAEGCVPRSGQAALQRQGVDHRLQGPQREPSSPTATSAKQALLRRHQPRRPARSSSFRGLGRKRYLSEPMNDPRLNQQSRARVAPTGSFSRLHQRRFTFTTWSATSTSGPPIPRAPSAAATTSTPTSTATAATTAPSRTTATYHDYSTGFRCCADAR